MKNKNKLIVLCFIIAILFVGNVFQFWNYYSKDTDSDMDTSSGIIFGVYPRNAVPDEETALNIAEAVLVSVYGEDVLSSKPFNVAFDESNQVWIIKGSLPEGTNGGVPEIVIKKHDGTILKIDNGM